MMAVGWQTSLTMSSVVSTDPPAQPPTSASDSIQFERNRTTLPVTFGHAKRKSAIRARR
jgi:hypothetical protein